MKHQNISIFILIGFLVCNAFSKKNTFFDYFYNKYHKSSSTTEGILISTTIISGGSSAEEISSVSGYTTHSLSSSQDDLGASVTTIGVFIQNGHPNSDEVRYSFIAKTGMIVGIVIFVVLFLGCTVCLCPTCCRGKQRRIVVMNRVHMGTEIPSPPIIHQRIEHPAVIQHIPAEFLSDPVQQFPPKYEEQPQTLYMPVPPGYQYSSISQPQSQYSPIPPGCQYSSISEPHYSPVQHGYQYCPTEQQFHNPPEAPPPYGATAPK